MIAWLAIQLGLAWAFSKLPLRFFDKSNSLPRVRSWRNRRRLCERLFAVRRWKNKLPDGGTWFQAGFAKKNLRGRSSSSLRQFANETRRGELVHWLALATLPLFGIWNTWPGLAINAVYAVTANIPCIIVKRYNRGRIAHVLARRLRAE